MLLTNLAPTCKASEHKADMSYLDSLNVSIQTDLHLMAILYKIPQHLQKKTQKHMHFTFSEASGLYAVNQTLSGTTSKQNIDIMRKSSQGK